MKGPLGEHYIIELYDCRHDILDNQSEIESTLLKAAELAEATIINKSFHKFSPQGVSGVIMIAESHLSIHTWPEYHYAALDFFTCSSRLKMDKVFRFLESQFIPEKMDIRRLQRGLIDLKFKKKIRPEKLQNVAS